MMVVTVTTEPTVRVSGPEVLFERRIWTGGLLNYDVSADGQRFVMIAPPDASPPSTTLVLVENWFEELKRLVPVN